MSDLTLEIYIIYEYIENEWHNARHKIIFSKRRIVSDFYDPYWYDTEDSFIAYHYWIYFKQMVLT